MIVQRLHHSYIAAYRARVLADHLARLLPQGLRVLDVGCGDGFIARRLQDSRPDLNVQGIDVQVRSETHVPVESFDGKTIPFADRSFDCSLLIDVLHHTLDVKELLREVIRVSRRYVAIKDHTAGGVFDRRLLAYMDSVSNKRFGMALPNNYLSRKEWDDVFAELHLKPESTLTRLSLYPWFADWFFGRRLHLLTVLAVPASDACGQS